MIAPCNHAPGSKTPNHPHADLSCRKCGMLLSEVVEVVEAPETDPVVLALSDREEGVTLEGLAQLTGRDLPDTRTCLARLMFVERRVTCVGGRKDRKTHVYGPVRYVLGDPQALISLGS